MNNKHWNVIQQPLFRWATSVERIICAHRLPELTGQLIYIVSDYSGSHESSNYQVMSALYLDLENSKTWESKRRIVRQRYLSDGRRLSFKALNDKQRQRALVPFLQAADHIEGLSVTLAIKKSIRELCIRKSEVDLACQNFGLVGNWKFKALESTIRVAHLIGLLIGGLSRPKQDIYWISDEDDLFANLQRASDLQKILGKFSGHYVKHELGYLGLGTTIIDEGDRIEEDLAAIPDLIAGTVSEVTTQLSKVAGGNIPVTLAIPFNSKFSPKTEVISSWLWHRNHFLKRVVIVVEENRKDGLVAFNLQMK